MSPKKSKCRVQKYATRDTATGTHMLYGITRCCLPPGRGDMPAFTPSKSKRKQSQRSFSGRRRPQPLCLQQSCRNRFSDPGRMQGWVELSSLSHRNRRRCAVIPCKLKQSWSWRELALSRSTAPVVATNSVGVDDSSSLKWPQRHYRQCDQQLTAYSSFQHNSSAASLVQITVQHVSGSGLGLTSSCVHWTCSSSSSCVQHYCPFFIYI